MEKTPSAEKRQRARTPRACDECKRKKKQCTGTHPCALCSSRSRTCIFSNTPAGRVAAAYELHKALSPDYVPSKRKRQSAKSSRNDPIDLGTLVGGVQESRIVTGDEETPLHNEGRMLQDGDGRLLYIGDSAALSFLQTIRRLVECNLGSSPFTIDSSRHKILEASISTPPRYQHTYGLPDIEAALYLVDSFFENTSGLFEIFNKTAFITGVTETYQNPLAAEPEWLCQLNLVFAVGFQLRKETAIPQPTVVKILERLQVRGVNRGEIFFLASKHLSDPICGFEDGGFSSIQSLFLMTIYMLTSSKRNTAWAYLGMAVRLSYALGLHKEETLPAFSLMEQDLRCKLWQSLYVMDCFLSASLGRPNAINQTELLPPPNVAALDNGKPSRMNASLASFTASKITGEILSRVYQTRKVSRSVALEVSQQFNSWMKDLPRELHWAQHSQEDSNGEIKLQRLHVNLIYFHGIILLTRPFLLYQIKLYLRRSEELQISAQSPSGHAAQSTQGDCFHGACVRSAVHSITVTNEAFLKHVLPKRDPFVIYWLFSASLVVLANTFCPVYYQPDGHSAIQISLKIMSFMAEVDLQARRYHTILESFNNAMHEARNAKEPSTTDQARTNIFNVLFGYDDALPSPKGIWTTRFSVGAVMDQSGDQSWDGINIQSSPAAGDDRSGQLLAYSRPAGNSVWPGAGLGTATDDSIDFDSLWWTGVQGDDTSNTDTPIPLYGLMKPI